MLINGYEFEPIGVSLVELVPDDVHIDWYELVPREDWTDPQFKPYFLIEHDPPNMAVTDMERFWEAGPYKSQDFLGNPLVVTPEYARKVVQIIGKFLTDGDNPGDSQFDKLVNQIAKEITREINRVVIRDRLL